MGPAVIKVVLDSPPWVQRTLAVIFGITAVAGFLAAGLFGYTMVKAFEIIGGN
jgi:hypothetical protein